MKNSNLFTGYKLEQDKNGYILILYLNDSDTEFAEEYLSINNRKKEDFDINILKFVKENFKDIKVVAVKVMVGSLLIATIAFGGAQYTQAQETNIPEVYTVQSGDSLWIISNRFGVSIDQIKTLNNLDTDYLDVGQKLTLVDTTNNTITKTEYEYYTVKSGDSLWKISQSYGVSINDIKTMNNMTSDVLYPGQSIKVKEIKTQGILYVVKSGDSLWKIANANNTTIDSIKAANKLTSDYLDVGQELFVPLGEYIAPAQPAQDQPTTEPSPAPVYNWPDVTYIVQAGDTVSGVAAKFNTTTSNILKYNYMDPDEWLNAGDKIAISDYAPRTYTVTPGEATAPATVGKLVDWVTEGQYLIKRGYEFTLVDVYTGKQINVRMLGGYNHSDIEPLTVADTNTMKSLFGSWQWNPRPVVIFINGMNIAGSLSGMPHSVSSITDNGVDGHFDLYLKNSSPHSSTASQSYVQMHQDMVNIAAGLK